MNWTSGTGAGTANRMVGGMAELTISRKDDNEVSLDKYDVRDLVCHLSNGDRGVTVYPLSEYTESLSKENAIIKQDPAFSLDYCIKLCEEVYSKDGP